MKRLYKEHFSPEFEFYGRGGTHSTSLLIWNINGKRLTPFEMKIKGISLPTKYMTESFKFMYPKELVAQLIYSDNPFLRKIK